MTRSRSFCAPVEMRPSMTCSAARPPSAMAIMSLSCAAGWVASVCEREWVKRLRVGWQSAGAAARPAAASLWARRAAWQPTCPLTHPSFRATTHHQPPPHQPPHTPVSHPPTCSVVISMFSLGRYWAKPRAADPRGTIDTCGGRVGCAVGTVHSPLGPGTLPCLPRHPQSHTHTHTPHTGHPPTLSRGSVYCRNQPTTACPASWYATVLRSSALITCAAESPAAGGGGRAGSAAGVGERGRRRQRHAQQPRASPHPHPPASLHPPTHLVLLLQPANHTVHRSLKVCHAHCVLVAARRNQRRLIGHVGNVGARKAGRQRRQPLCGRAEGWGGGGWPRAAPRPGRPVALLAASRSHEPAMFRHLSTTTTTNNNHAPE